MRLPLLCASVMLMSLSQCRAVSFPEDEDPINVVDYHYSRQYPVFRGRPSGNESQHRLDFQLMLKIRDTLYIAGRDQVYTVNLNEVPKSEVTASKKLTWRSRQQDRENCAMKGKHKDECHNFIKVFVPRNDEMVFVCGTNAFNPMCRYYRLNTLEYDGEEISGLARCPFDARQTNVALFAVYGLTCVCVPQIWGITDDHKNGEYFDQSHVALPNVSKFFLHQALEERKAAEALMKYQQERGGHYCSKTIQKPNCEYAVGLMKALEVAMVQWKTMIRYFEELYALSIENADPHSASTIKKQFIGPKIRKIKLMGDLLTNARRLDCSQDGRNSLGDYFMDRLQKEFRTGIELESSQHCSPCPPLQQCTGAAEGLKRPQRESYQHRNGIGPIYATIHCTTTLPQCNDGTGAKVKQGREGL